MKRFIRILAFALLLAAAAMLAASIGVVMPRTVHVAGPDGTPTAAWAAHRYRGQQSGNIFLAGWSRPGGIIEADREGNIHLPFKLYLKAPTDGWLDHDIILIHAPALHSTVHPGVVKNGAVFPFADNSNDPAAWDHALDEIHSLLAHDLTTELQRPYRADRPTIVRLSRIVAAEYHGLLSTYDDRRREIPGSIPGHLQFASQEDKEAWTREMRAEIEREPTWGAYLRVRYSDSIAKIERHFGS